MYVNNLEQLRLFIIFIIVGIIISILFDFFRILRKTIKTSDIATYVEDTIFWIVSGMIILFSIFVFNNGELRFFIFIGIFVGILIYMIFISKYFIKLNLKIIKIIQNFLLKILQIILKPFKFIFYILKKFLFKPISFIFINFRTFYKKILRLFKILKKNDKKLDKNEGL